MRRLPIVAALAVLGLLSAAAPAPAATRAVPHNPVSAGAADTFADPAVIRGRDGFWYAYGTSDPLLRRADRATADPDPALPGPVRLDVRRRRLHAGHPPVLGDADGRAVGARHPLRRGPLLLYFTVTDTTLNEGDDSAIGVATAPTPDRAVDADRARRSSARARRRAAVSCGRSTRPGSPTRRGAGGSTTARTSAASSPCRCPPTG